jgi:uncharacterized caspase-like protein
MSKQIAVRRVLNYAVPALALIAVGIGTLIASDIELTPDIGEAASGSTATVQPAPAASERDAARTGARVALIIANAKYPDADAPLAHPSRDAEALAGELRRGGFVVDVRQDLGKEEMRRTIDGFIARIQPGTVALLSYSGFGIQVSRQSYMIPVNAQIWKEADVRRDGISVESVIGQMNAKGASAKLVILDASRRNPFERRFRGYSAGLAAIDAPQRTLVMSAAAPGAVAYDGNGANSLMIEKLLGEMTVPSMSAEDAFNRTRMSVSRATRGEQVPSVSSSLVETFQFRDGTTRHAEVPQPRATRGLGWRN